MTLDLASPELLSLQIGLPRQLGTAGATNPKGRPWATGFDKRRVIGPVRLGLTNLDGWRREPGMSGLPFGAFGENFTAER